MSKYKDALKSMQEALKAMQEALAEMNAGNAGEDEAAVWAREYGEAVTRKRVAQIMGVSPTTVAAWIRDGYLQLTPDGNKVLVRPAARWYSSGGPKRARYERRERKAGREPCKWHIV